MDTNDLKKLDTDLAKEEAEIRNQLKSFGKESPLTEGDFEVTVEDLGESEDDNAQEAGELDRDQAMVNTLEKRLKSILNTRNKIKSGTYGK